MTRELVIKIHCDFCSKEVPEKDAHSGELILNGKFYEIDLCGEHASSLTASLTLMPASQASVKTQAATKVQPRKYAATPKSERKVPCGICGVLCKNALGVRFHMVKMHPVEAAAENADKKDESS
jgi:hypothetical protein